MNAALIQNLAKSEGKKVKLNGWVYNSRRSGKIGFLLLRDGTGIVQCVVVKNEVGGKLFDTFKTLTQESSISIEGEIVKNDRSPGGFEILLSHLVVHHLIDGYPISPKDHGTEFLMNQKVHVQFQKMYLMEQKEIMI